MILTIMDQRQTPEVYVEIPDNYLGTLKAHLLKEGIVFLPLLPHWIENRLNVKTNLLPHLVLHSCAKKLV